MIQEKEAHRAVAKSWVGNWMGEMYHPIYFCCVGDYGAVLKKRNTWKTCVLFLHPLAGGSRLGGEVPELVGLARKIPRDSARVLQDLPG